MIETNRGKYLKQNWVFRDVALPGNYYLALVTDSPLPNTDTNTLGELTEIADGNGYDTGGYELTPGDTDFPDLVEDDDLNLAVLHVKDVVWTASGGPIPAEGEPARYAVLVTDEATPADRQVIAYIDLGKHWTIASGRSITLSSGIGQVKIDLSI